ncbi:MAG: hypothetical protein IJW97_00665 [Clostridia bacterium]|nr:hypothetical protein [Clostridia bacterium]
MPTWNEICAGVDRLAKKINQSVEGVADQAALQLKLSTCRGNLEEEYKTLGKLAYQRLYVAAAPAEVAESEREEEQAESTAEQTSTDDLTAQINSALARITSLLAEIEMLEKKLK